MTSPTAADDQPDKEYSRANPSKFRFKSKRSRKECDEEDLDHHRSRRRKHSDDGAEPSRHDDDDQRRRRHHRRHHHHRSHRSKRQETPPQPAAPAEPTEEEPLSPNTAFRLSLFDAMADDEGALFWEGVYGQPMHTYPRPSAEEGTDGFLESMTDDEYAEYVRTKMWEKTHQHVIEERERRERRKAEEKRRREDGARREREGEEFRRRVDESLRRGEARREGKRWKSVWDAYLQRWDDIMNANNDNNPQEQSDRRAPKHVLPWPVETGSLRHVNRDEVERFWLNVPVPDGALMDTLKKERVRWHPDKIQQRFGGGVDEATMKAVTAIFQVVDQLWCEMREKEKEKAKD
ncbi:hypothetical protein IWX49DRAFT_555615 [Phyllosticta citricarpa]|uniref:Uncharacterized protein n=2 Tax=Phyllosticta TaxID=121621 RepID=A0ABR1MFT5_9PEZI